MIRNTWMMTAVLALGGTAWAQALQFDPESGLPLRRGERVLIEEVDTPIPVDSRGLRREEGERVISLLGEDVRKEFASFDNRVEYTFEFRLPTDPGKLSYELLVPLPRGTAARVTHDGYRNPKNEEVVVGESKAKALEAARFITIRSGEKGFAVDLDPAGSWQDGSNFDKPIRMNRVQVTPEGLRIVIVRGWNEWGGGRLGAKLVVYPEPVDFGAIHPYHEASYKTPLAAHHFLDFTTRKRNKPPKSTGVQPFNADRGYGWVEPSADLKIVQREAEGLLHSGFATSTAPATFRMTAPPGDYVLTAVVGDLEQPVGPMRILANGKPLAELRVKPADFQNPSAIVTTEDGVIDLRLEGRPWVLNGVILQPLMLAHEDYGRRLPWWHHEQAWPAE